MPARSKNHWFPMPPLSGRTPLVVTSVVMPFRDAGPWHDATVCSQMPMVTRFAETETADPLLEPRGTRSVSYGLHAWPAHALIAWPPASAFVRLCAFPPGSPDPALNSCAFDSA